jgi:hypothetical protein
MTFDLFGYNGVLGLDQSVVNKLLDSFVYETHLIESAGQVTNGDFFAVSAQIDGGSIHVYLEIARPFLHVSTADGTNTVTLHLPFTDIGVFVTRAGMTQRISVPAKFALVLFGVSIQKNSQGLTIDVSKVTGNDLAFALVQVHSGPTDVGGSQVNTDQTILIPDGTLEQFLKDPNSPTGAPVIIASELRSKLADFVRGGALGVSAIPVSPAAQSSELAQWDLMLFGNANDRDVNDAPDAAGADILLFQDAQHGEGERTEAGFILPPALALPEYGWSVNLSAQVLSDAIREALDKSPYWVQGGTINTPTQPYGYMVVLAAQQSAYALPSGSGKVIVHASQNHQVNVEFQSGSFPPHSRAHLDNLTSGARANFEADGSGAAKTSIQADPGERLALTVDAVSLPGDSATVIWRPRIEFAEGELRVATHYYRYIEHWCDAEGDAWLRTALAADRSKPFAVSATVLDADASAPWWAYLVTWVGTGLLGQGVFAPVLLALVPSVTHSVARSLIGDKAAAQRR